MAELFTASDVRDALVFAISDDGSAADYARRVGVSRSHICHILAGRKKPHGAVLADLGFVAADLYEAAPLVAHPNPEDSQ